MTPQAFPARRARAGRSIAVWAACAIALLSALCPPAGADVAS